MNKLKPIVMGVPGGVVMFLGMIYSLKHLDRVIPGVLLTFGAVFVVMGAVEWIWDWVAERRKG